MNPKPVDDIQTCGIGMMLTMTINGVLREYYVSGTVLCDLDGFFVFNVYNICMK